MQLDFHHAVTYVAARLAGFPHDSADIIAYAAQYVDDATYSGVISFTNGALYTRISSSHKSLDGRNLDRVEDRLVWAPFHFLPGNCMQPAGQALDQHFVSRLVCRPDSCVAREMVAAAFESRGKAHALHRLGIALHAYADTWAHQGFAGVIDDINYVRAVSETGDSGAFGGLLHELLDAVIVAAAPSLGHGKAYVFPDMPFLCWRYEDGFGQAIERNNTSVFCDAADTMCRTMQAYLGCSVTGFRAADKAQIRGLFANLRDINSHNRHREWLKAIAAGAFSFGPAVISYDPDGEASWKARILGTARDLPQYPYRDEFLTSDWKRFHDALQEHRITVLHDILPRYGICLG